MAYVALITGASSGIGEAVARRLAREPGVQLILVARREDRLQAVAADTGAAVFAADLADPATADLLAEFVQREFGALHLLVNNAGARWATDFEGGGWDDVARHMRVNFEAPVRLVQALLPLLRRTAAASGPLTKESAPAATGPLAGSSAEAGQRASFSGIGLRAPVSIVNVTSTSAKISRIGTGAYSASKAALGAWSDSLYLEERKHGVHVANVLPGFIATEGFPQAELRASIRTRWAVSDVEHVAEAVIKAGPGGAPEVYVPGYYRLSGLLRAVAPRLIRRAASAASLATETNSV